MLALPARPWEGANNPGVAGSRCHPERTGLDSQGQAEPFPAEGDPLPNVWGGANWGELVWGALQLPIPALEGVGLLALGGLLVGASAWALRPRALAGRSQEAAAEADD